jgi:predicted ATP-dependent endonuclease of OLD family
MYIERVQVEEGFLNGLDVNFSSGLNVIIGARGTGKTSLIELIRFCLDAPANTNEVAKRSREHALSILGGGQVTITASLNGQKIIVSRATSDAAPRASGFYEKPIVFSQTEIETIGLEASGRLRLIDSFLISNQTENAEENQAVTEIASLTAETSRLRREIEAIETQLRESSVIESELKTVIALEAGVAKTSIILQEKTGQLQFLSTAISNSGVAEVEINRLKEQMAEWYHLIKSAREYQLDESSKTSETLRPFNQVLISTKSQLESALAGIYSIWSAINSKTTEISEGRLITESQARSLRQEVEQLQAGAGNIMRRSQDLKEKKAKLDSMIGLLASRKAMLQNISQRRSIALDRLEKIRTDRFQRRAIVAQELNSKLSPNIRIKILRNGQQAKFSVLISELLRGSGIKYGDIAALLATRVSPRLLLDAIDRFDIEMIAEASQISLERASRILSHLRNCDLGSLGSVDIEDEVVLQLLDGVDYKDLSTLSTGQRCTVILPLLLSHADKVLIVDQPEDHIDNAFIANTLIRAVLGRSMEGQIIFSTHNPNIPVLGNADNVIQLESDGRRGFVSSFGNLNELAIVSAISTVMEGGLEAFSRRANFYDQILL